MIRSAARFTLAAVLITFATPAFAQRSVNGFPAPSQAVADAWAKEARQAREARDANGSRSSTAAKVLYGSYGVLQGLDMYSTIVARNKGAREVNPLMNTGYTQATTLKAVLTATTIVGVKAMEKKNKKAAMVTMIAMNGVTAAVVANNFRNARRLR